MSGFFLTLEGSEGGGKTTQREWMADWFRAAGFKVCCTREPGGTPMAESLREILLAQRDESVSPNTELLILFAARQQHLDQVIRPALARGEIVICDRFIDSSYAYQVAGRGLDHKTFDVLVDICVQDTLPDMTFLFELPYELGLARSRKRAALDRMESSDAEFFARVAQGYSQQARRNPDRYRRIDASVDIPTVQAQLIAHLMVIQNRMRGRGPRPDYPDACRKPR